MPTPVRAEKFVRLGNPSNEGRTLATSLLTLADLDWEDLAVDLLMLRSELLISAFFLSFLQCVSEQRPDLIDHARRIRWDVRHDFQRENISRWMRDFVPGR